MSIRQTFTDIANAIREKTGSTGLLYPSEMAQNILDIPQGGGEDYLPAFIEGTANFEDYASSIRNLSAIKDYAFYNNNTVINANFPKVEGIGECAFANCTNLQTANFPKCSYIGYSGFNSCSKITEAIFPECLTVYTGAFYSCRSLTTAYFPKATSLGNNTFYSCVNLTSIEAPLLESIGGGIFYNCSKLSEANFPLLTTIGSAWGTSPFASTALKSIYFPLVSYVGANAFINCKSLTTASLPNVYNMGDGVFRGCTSLETVTLGAYSYTSITSPSTLFSGCTNLKSIYVPSGALNYYQTSSWWSYWSDKIVPYDESDEYIYPYEYANNTTITEIPLSKQNATNVGYNAFLGCTNLKSVNLPNCDGFYNGMFSSASNLKNSVEFINIGVRQLESHSFYGCTNLREFHAPNTTIFGSNPIASCPNLSIVSLPNIEEIPDIEYYTNGLYSLSNLETVNLHNCKAITRHCFWGDIKLRNVDLSNLESIPTAAFSSCHSLEEIDLPKCVGISREAFDGCSALRTVRMPNLESWGESPFYGCSSLESVYIGSNVTYVGGDCVPTSGSTKIYVPNDMVDTYKNGLFSSYSSMIYGY